MNSLPCQNEKCRGNAGNTVSKTQRTEMTMQQTAHSQENYRVLERFGVRFVVAQLFDDLPHANDEKFVKLVNQSVATSFALGFHLLIQLFLCKRANEKTKQRKQTA